MNTDQILSLVRSLLKSAGAGLVTHGYVTAGHLELIIGALVAAIGFICSHIAHSDETPQLQQGKLLSLFLLFTVSFGAIGCSTVYNSDKITAIKTRGFGVQVPISEAEKINLGWFSSVVEIIPTSTNALNAPRYMQAYRLTQSANPFATGIEENSGTGEVYVGGTNDVSKAIVPSPFIPPKQQ